MGRVIRYEDLVEGRKYVDGQGTVWTLKYRSARNHSHVFTRGNATRYANEHRMTEDGWQEWRE